MITQPKKQPSALERAMRIGVGFATGGPVGAGMALASEKNPQLESIYGLYQMGSGAFSPSYTDKNFLKPEIGDSFTGQRGAMARRLGLGDWRF